jgi:uncharacterized membrane protein YozB (DUF420 family)
MHRAGRMTTWLGVIVTLAGIIAGFTLIKMGYDQHAKFFLMTVPIGFVLLLTGVVTAFLADDSEGPVNPE